MQPIRAEDHCGPGLAYVVRSRSIGSTDWTMTRNTASALELPIGPADYEITLSVANDVDSRAGGRPIIVPAEGEWILTQPIRLGKSAILRNLQCYG